MHYFLLYDYILAKILINHQFSWGIQNMHHMNI